LPFDLHPEYPPEGVPLEELSRRYGRDLEPGQIAMFDDAGLPHAPRTKMPNSRAALNVAELARERGVHKPFHERLMTAFWGEDRDISDPDVLAEEGEKFGLDPDEVRDVAKNHTYQSVIEASTQAVLEIGAGGVPAFVVDDRALIPGAQPHSLFEKVMDKFEHESVASTDARDSAES
jgi:predicted DsbA family dithiol-disulfide isomerase